uniref:Uncharacterized protein n=1 Tax=Knipowitschia caucasica TaxID=637954 RepID=A0AAV2JND5_KNICA
MVVTHRDLWYSDSQDLWYSDSQEPMVQRLPDAQGPMLTHRDLWWYSGSQGPMVQGPWTATPGTYGLTADVTGTYGYRRLTGLWTVTHRDLRDLGTATLTGTYGSDSQGPMVQ